MYDSFEQLGRYRQMQARLQVLSTYSIGAGITVSRLNQDDQLQELHRQLRGKPSYMYLSKHDQQLESTAHAYLTRYPAGIKAQLKAVPSRGADAEDDKQLRKLREKIEKVIAARGYDTRDDMDAVLDRITELQELQDELARIDTILEALGAYKPNYARLLRLVYVEGKPIEEIRALLSISNRTYWRHIGGAEREYNMLAR